MESNFCRLKMLLIAVVLFFSLLFWLLVSALSDGSWLGFVAITLLYYVIGEWLHRNEVLHCPSARRSKFVRWFNQTYYGVHISQISSRLRHDFGCKNSKRYIFALEPHHVQCLHIVWCFAAPGDMLPPSILDDTRVVAHWCHRLIPFVRELYSMFGVIDSSRYTIETAMKYNRYHLALIPSGFDGKIHALIGEYFNSSGLRLVSEDRRETVHIYRRKRHGFIRLAIKHHYSIVPVVSCEEANCFELWLESSMIWWLVLPVGRNFIFPLKDKLPVVIGASLDFTEYVDSKPSEKMINDLADQYYRNIVSLVQPEYKVKFHYALY